MNRKTTTTKRKAPAKRKKMQAGGSASLGEEAGRARAGRAMGSDQMRQRMLEQRDSDRRSARRSASIPAAVSRERAAAARRRPSETSANERRAAVAAKRLEDPLKVQRTGGGNYGTYQRGSRTAQSFREAYAAARRAGKDTFTWRNRRYTTE